MPADRPDLVGAIAAEALVTLLKTHGSNSGDGICRVVGFSEPEALALVAALDGVVVNAPEAVRVVTDPSRSDVFPGWSRPEEGRTFTYYRDNLSSRGLILIELTRQSDHQGLADVFEFTPSSLIRRDTDQPLDEDLLQAMARRVVGLEGASWTPSVDSAVRVMLTADNVSVGWITAARAATYVAAVATSSAEDGPGRALDALQLFPDSEVMADIDERVRVNVHCASLLTPQGREARYEALVDLINASVRVNRSACLAFVDGDRSRISDIDFADWRSIFPRRSSGRQKLSERIKEDLGSVTRQLEKLCKKLDAGDQEAAEDFADQSEFHSLSPTLRKAILKIASPEPELEHDPILALTRLIAEADGDLTVKVDGDPAPWTLLMFQVLHGPALRTAIARLHAAGVDRLTVSAGLVSGPSKESLESLEASEEDEEGSWDPLFFRIEADGVRHEFKWRPTEDLGLLGRISLEHSDAWPSAVGARLDGNNAFRGSNAILASGADPTPDSVDVIDRAEFVAAVRAGGLDPDVLGQRVQRFIGRLASLVDQGDARQSVGGLFDGNEQLLRVDTDVDDGVLRLLPTHPIILRWFSQWNERRIDLLVEAGSTNTPADEIRSVGEFLVERRPVGQPGLGVVSGPDRLLVDVGIDDLRARFEPVDGPTKGSRIDADAVRQLEKTLADYWEAYPQSADRTELLVLLPGIDRRSLLDFLKRIERVAERQGDLHVVVAVERSELVALDLVLDSVDRAAQFDSGSVTPSVEYTSIDVEELSTADLVVDVAFAPDYFSDGGSLQWDNVPHNPKAFDSVLGRATYTTQDGGRTVLLPDASDPLLENWARLSRWRATSSHFTTARPALEAQLETKQSLFLRLHELANWVLTVDRFVGREQIDALGGGRAVEVIQSRDSVGTGSQHTAVCSSKTGGEEVLAQLRTRLDELLPSPAAAEAIFDIARVVAPGNMLRAIGAGRSVEELIGLAVCRSGFDSLNGPHLDVWVSLDDFADWFGKGRGKRADLARFRFIPVTSGLELQITAIESKFRTANPRAAATEAVDQVVRARDQLAAAVGVRVLTNRIHQRFDQPIRLARLAALLLQVTRIEHPYAAISGLGLARDDVIRATTEGNVVVSKIDGVVFVTSTVPFSPPPLDHDIHCMASSGQDFVEQVNTLVAELGFDEQASG